ncbi:DMT family transporter [Marivivens aquimaris]|uniref:DMT family transporter n=1 Tax=Marivivens aquimaris TaxID=2774876 RepID=UPI00187FB3AB|nr:DMT family transporter [Marivivens aquimaris]
MDQTKTIRLATVIVTLTGVLWGLYWMPVRAMDGLGLLGAWGTLAITVAAAVILLPFAIRHAAELRRADGWAIASLLFGGAAFAMYSISLVDGRVAIIILLYFLTPVWSTLIARFVFGEETTLTRLLAIIAGIAGLGVFLSADGTIPYPRSWGEWMALISGMMWAVATTGMKYRPSVKPLPAAFVFACGAAGTSLFFALLSGAPDFSGLYIAPVIGTAILAGGLWWGASLSSLMWATARLEPARVGILLMTEVIAGTISAAIFAGEMPATQEILGGLLVLTAGVLEIWPERKVPAFA